MKKCEKCNSSSSLVKYRDLNYEEYSKDQGHHLKAIFLCKECIATREAEYGYCEDCGDDQVYDLEMLSPVMYESGLFCPKHLGKYNESEEKDEDEARGREDSIEFLTKDD